MTEISQVSKEILPSYDIVFCMLENEGFKLEKSRNEIVMY